MSVDMEASIDDVHAPAEFDFRSRSRLLSYRALELTKSTQKATL